MRAELLTEAEGVETEALVHDTSVSASSAQPTMGCVKDARSPDSVPIFEPDRSRVVLQNFISFPFLQRRFRNGGYSSHPWRCLLGAGWYLDGTGAWARPNVPGPPNLVPDARDNPADQPASANVPRPSQFLGVWLARGRRLTPGSPKVPPWASTGVTLPDRLSPETAITCPGCDTVRAASEQMFGTMCRWTRSRSRMQETV